MTSSTATTRSGAPSSGWWRVACAGTLLALGACSVFVPEDASRRVPPAPERPAGLPPIATHTFPFEPKTTGVVGVLQVTHTRHEDTLADIARRFDLGFDEVARANPGVDPWLPGEGTRIVLPTQFVLPEAPAEGLVINIAALRAFYFPKAAKGEARTVVTFPIGIGKIGWATPVGTTKIVSKRKDPYWTPPESVRKEHAEEGDILPARVPPGPDNPLGAYAMNLGWPSYLIHGTNKPAGVGLRASHGCIRMYPEDIAALFDGIPIGTRVTVVDQSLLYRWQGDSLYVQSYPPHLDQDEDPAAEKPPVFKEAMLSRMWQRAKPHGGQLDRALVEQVVNEQRGVAVPVSRAGLSFESFVGASRMVENELPEGARWDGHEEPSTEAQSQPVATSGQQGGR
jgi:L,D-transpeptidase ErfK/SrfK